MPEELISSQVMTITRLDGGRGEKTLKMSHPLKIWNSDATAQNRVRLTSQKHEILSQCVKLTKLQKINEKIDNILDTPRQYIPNKHLRTPLVLSPYVFNACEQNCIMMIMRWSNMPRAEYDLRAILYPTHSTHHIMCNARGIKTQLTRYPLQ